MSAMGGRSAHVCEGDGGLGPNRAFSTRGRRVRIWSPRNENIGGTLQHRFTPWIAQEISVTNDSPIGFGFRLTHFQNRHFGDRVHHPGRTAFGSLSSSQPNPTRTWKCGRSRLVNKMKIAKVWEPDALSPPNIERRGLLVDVARYWIILHRELDNLVLKDEVGSSRAAGSDFLRNKGWSSMPPSMKRVLAWNTKAKRDLGPSDVAMDRANRCVICA
jgi:hypothetical protein